MRILHVTDTYHPTVGGIEVLVESLASRQAAAGHDVTVLTRTPRQGPTGPDAESGVVVSRDSSDLVRLTRWADCVHAHVSAFSPLALRSTEIAAAESRPVVATVHSMWGNAWPIVGAVARLRRWPAMPIQWAAVSEAAAGPVQRALAGQPVLLLPNAVDTSQWASAPQDSHSGEVTIVSVQRMVRRKRPLPLLAMLREARELVPEHIRIRAVLGGDGAQLAAVRRRIEKWGMESWVEAPGPLTHAQLRTLYRGADIFIAPATRESFGIAALEARTSGLAIVAQAATGVSEFVRHETDGLLAENDAQMVSQLARLCRDDALRDRIKAHNQAERPAFDWTDILWRAEYAYSTAAERVPGRQVQHLGVGSSRTP
ncbi:MAG TPA: glycosyltransferase family 4 protein [Pedococcus sp.]|nr:glycosyltransferase family 4 protein [Pedococcus sp.]